MPSTKSSSNKDKISKMEKLAVKLSLARHKAFQALPEVERSAGLPINALPGWESIPLHSKLPMLKCPDNQVIFTKNKIGRSFETSGDFDPVCLNAKMEYNPLHDPHLRRFYSNEKLLKRLRENKEITDNNDVICTLKEFNEYRIPLHEEHLNLIRNEKHKMNEDKRDRQMIAHAEQIAEREKKLADKGTKGFKKSGDGRVQERKTKLDLQRAKMNQALYTRLQRKQQHIEAMKAARIEQLDGLKNHRNIMIMKRLETAMDLRRSRLIAIKKHLQYKWDRLKNNRKLLKENAYSQAKEKARQSWEQHLKERTLKHEHVKQIQKDNERDIKEWIENHIAKYQAKWNEIQSQIESRSRPARRRLPRRKRIAKKIRLSLAKSQNEDLRNLSYEDIKDALHTVIDMEDPKLPEQPEEDQYIYKAAKYILESVLAKFDKDLSGQPYLECVLAERISRLFTDVKQYVLERATQILSNGNGYGTEHKSFSKFTKSQRCELIKCVSFSAFTKLIGKGSYDLTGVVKMSSERPPTPAASLTSIVIEDDNDDLDEGSLHRRKPSLHYLTRDEKIFVEHLFIKFKKQLIVGVGRQVIAAVECHKNNKIMDVRKELQEIDKQFLVKIMTRSILSYAINSCNFHSNALLCQHALAGDIILALQKDVLKPERDPRVIVQPRTRCACRVPTPFAKYCN